MSGIRTVFACPAHAPCGVESMSHDDGRPACDVCGAASYAVKPYGFTQPVGIDGRYWRLCDGTIVRPRT